MSRCNAPNLLDPHPEGLGEQVKVYALSPPEYKLDGFFFKEYINKNHLPFLVTLDDLSYVVILDKEVVKDLPFEFDADYAKYLITDKHSDVLRGVWEFLALDIDTLHICPIGWQQ